MHDRSELMRQGWFVQYNCEHGRSIIEKHVRVAQPRSTWRSIPFMIARVWPTLRHVGHMGIWAWVKSSLEC